MKKQKLTPVHVIDLAVRDDGYFTRNDLELVSFEFGKVMLKIEINTEANVSPFFVATEHFEPADFLEEFNLSCKEDLEKITEEQLMQRYNSGKGHISCTAKHIDREFRRHGAHTYVLNPESPEMPPQVFEHALTLKEIEAYTLALKEADIA
ncbi:MAG: hypothetical protein EOO92_21405 [Pedobacter sp.]|nr:MAG: hypothetical protein EOO92_21405 [Pedobacter sp.]